MKLYILHLTTAFTIIMYKKKTEITINVINFCPTDQNCVLSVTTNLKDIELSEPYHLKIYHQKKKFNNECSLIPSASSPAQTTDKNDNNRNLTI